MKYLRLYQPFHQQQDGFRGAQGRKRICGSTLPSNGKEELKARTVAQKRVVIRKLFKKIGKFSLDLGMGRVYLPMDT